MFVQNNNFQIACPVECKTCVDSLTCLTCETGYALYNDQCIGTCPAGTYLSTTQTCESIQYYKDIPLILF